MKLARRVLEQELSEDQVADWGCYEDKYPLAEELGFPRNWEETSWQSIFAWAMTARGRQDVTP